MPTVQPLPIDSVADQLRNALSKNRTAILAAEPGAGKTTRVPLILRDEPWLAEKKVLMLEPRRLAARRSAEFMSSQLGEDVGGSIGYRIRGESRTGAKTRIEVVTEGILTRMLHENPDLPGIGLVIFDEFHERSIHADVGLAFTLDVQSHLRSDLRVLVMSATLDGIGIQSVLPNAPLVSSTGRQFPVETIYAKFSSDKRIEERVAEMTVRALQNHEGDVLAFLPGRREISRTAELLAALIDDDSVHIHQLYGEADRAQQNSALARAQTGSRKIILATNIAETSLTIDGVRIVVDGGFARVSEFNPRRGMSGLATAKISKASADQRRGRAGRQAPGTCYRLWTEAEHTTLSEFSTPEIKSSDLTPLALDLARWGAPLGEGLRFIDPPPTGHLGQARSLLTQLGALESNGTLTDHGRALSGIPTHPRLAHMLLRVNELQLTHSACLLAALLEERDPLGSARQNNADVQSRLDALETDEGIDPSVRKRILRQAESLNVLMKKVGLEQKRPHPAPLLSGEGGGFLSLKSDKRSAHFSTSQDTHLLPLKVEGGDGVVPTNRLTRNKSHRDLYSPGLLLSLAYPDRVARKRAGSTNRFLLRNGTTAVVAESDPLARQEFLSIAEVDDKKHDARVFLAAALTEEELRSAFVDQIVFEEDVRWDSKSRSVVTRTVEKLGAIELSAKPMALDGEHITAAMIAGIRELGLNALPWTTESRALCFRIEWLRKNGFADWPAFDEASLLSSLEDWLAPWSSRVWKAEQLRSIDLDAALQSRIQNQRQQLERLVPSHIALPSGTRAHIDYESGNEPVLAVRLQELFGQAETPRIANGIPLLVHLLSPAKRPLAVTKDLHSFWMNTYPTLVKQLRMKYPKHVWPEDPLNAAPTNKTKRRR